MTWRKSCYNAVHSGILGAHRSAEVTYKLLDRAVWWPDMDKDVKTCMKGRSRPTKVEAKPVECLAEACWQEVSIDCEGPNP